MSAVHFVREDAGDLAARCGIRNWSALTYMTENVTCLMCRNLIAGTHGLGNRRTDVKPCGTTAAYRRHVRHGEAPCESCLQAERRKYEDYRKARYGKAA
jgi:hypothetical protein